jgi:hypothetical protein
MLEPRRKEFAGLRDHPLKDIRDNYYIGPNELVSPVLDFNTVEIWGAMFHQISRDLDFDDNQGGWLNGFGGLHVHFAQKVEQKGTVEFETLALDLQTIKNTLALYGLFETEIEKWLRIRRRNLGSLFPTADMFSFLFLFFLKTCTAHNWDRLAEQRLQYTNLS